MTSLYPKTLICSMFSVAIMAGCGPETNSRYGDEHWDPQSTWDAAQVIDQPDLKVYYRETGDETKPLEAYVEIDYSDLIFRDEGGDNTGLLAYSTGKSEPVPVDDLLQNTATFSDPAFVYDDAASEDRRLLLEEPGEYTFYLDLSVRQPNSTLRIYNFTWNDIVVPGTIGRDEFYDTYVNALISENCVECHRSGGTGSAAFDIADTSNIMNSFLTEIEEQPLGRELPDYPFSTTHTGSANASQITGTDRTNFNLFVDKILEANESGADAAGTEIIFVPIPNEYENDTKLDL